MKLSLKHKKQRGAYSVELALTLSVLIGFLLIFWEYAAIFIVHQRVTYSAYMSERSRVVGGNPQSVGSQLEGGQTFVGESSVLTREQLSLPVNLIRPWGGDTMLYNVQREVGMPSEPDDYGDNEWMSSVIMGGSIPNSEPGPVNSQVIGGNARSFASSANPIAVSTYPNVSSVIVYRTAGALEHYFNGNGEPVELGPETKNDIINSPTQLEKAKKIREGRNKRKSGNYPVDIEDEAYHVGYTTVYYEQTCLGDTCATIFTSKDDGFWDPIYDADSKGFKGEVLGGTPFEYKPFDWEETYPNPYLD